MVRKIYRAILASEFQIKSTVLISKVEIEGGRGGEVGGRSGDNSERCLNCSAEEHS